MAGLAAGIIVSQKDGSAVHAKMWSAYTAGNNPAALPDVFHLMRNIFVPFAQKDARFGRKLIRKLPGCRFEG
ncbi:MAG: hypothetical protein ACTHN2_13600 [Nitrobacter sp.]|jgi:hypothetical protein